VSSLAVREARESGLHCWYAEILRIHADICRHHDQAAEAEATTTLARETAKRQGAALWSLRIKLDMIDSHDLAEVDLPATLAAFPAGADLPEMRRAQAVLAQ